MYIIVTLENGALIVDCRRMMMSKTMMTSIGECRFGQTQRGAAKSMRNFMHSGAVMLTMTAIVCVIPVTAMSHPPFSKIVLMEIQRYSSMD